MSSSSLTAVKEAAGGGNGGKPVNNPSTFSKTNENVMRNGSVGKDNYADNGKRTSDISRPSDGKSAGGVNGSENIKSLGIFKAANP